MVNAKFHTEYWTFIRYLRNDSTVKKGFIQQHHISAIEHIEYMERYAECYYVAVSDDFDEEADWYPPLGYCGVIENDIRVAVSPQHHGRGVGVFMINELKKKHPKAFAKVKFENEASLKLFEKCGFKIKYLISNQKF